MRSSLELKLKKQFLFPPISEEDSKIMKYTEFLEIEIHDSPRSSEIFYIAAVDAKSVRCCPEFIRFIDDCGSYETASGPLKSIFRYSHEETTDLLFFVVGNKQFLIDNEGYLHLGTLFQETEPVELEFFKSTLSDYYGFKVYEKERSRI